VVALLTPIAFLHYLLFVLERGITIILSTLVVALLTPIAFLHNLLFVLERGKQSS
jgi:hypothetical protein